jgi:Domain of unknown function (DUF1707)
VTTANDPTPEDPTGSFQRHAVPGPQPIRLRASDADRHATVTVLQDATARGLLSHDEGGERMAAAWAARFQDELPVLTADLPAPRVEPTASPGWRQLSSLTVAQVRTTAGDLATGGWRSRQTVVLIALLVLIGLVVGVAALHGGIGGVEGPPGGFGHPH